MQAWVMRAFDKGQHLPRWQLAFQQFEPGHISLEAVRHGRLERPVLRLTFRPAEKDPVRPWYPLVDAALANLLSEEIWLSGMEEGWDGIPYFWGQTWRVRWTAPR